MFHLIRQDNEYQNSPTMTEISIRFWGKIDKTLLQPLVDKEDIFRQPEHTLPSRERDLGASKGMIVNTFHATELIFSCAFQNTDRILIMAGEHLLHVGALAQVESILVVEHISGIENVEGFLERCDHKGVEYRMADLGSLVIR